MSANRSAALDWQPSATLAAAQCRARMLRRARDFFAAHDVLEVDSPILSRAAVTDPHIESVSAGLQLDPETEYFLQTSPEFPMKRMLCAGYPDIFEICKVFRDGECGRQHQPEFTLVEWYRLGFDLQQIAADTVAFLTTMIRPGLISGPARQVLYRDAFLQATGVDPLCATLAALKSAADDDERLESVLGDRRDDWLDLLLTQKIAPGFARDRLTVLSHYPASQAALARLSPDNAEVAERFEVFFGNLELANGYVELTDALEQRARCDADQAARRAAGRRRRPLDESFLAALDSGLPDCAGVAVGFDRLLMINCSIDDIAGVQSFAFAGPGDAVK